MVQQKNCLVCGCLFQKLVNETQRRWDTKRKYCSVECKNHAPCSQESRLKMRSAKLGKPSWNKGIPCEVATKQKLSKALSGRKLSDVTRRKMLNRTPWNKIGDGVTPVHARIRKSPQYKEWRKQVFERDNYTCQHCGKHGGDLNADHIKPFTDYPELRFNLTNGRTLCVPCHRKTETYGINQWTRITLQGR